MESPPADNTRPDKQGSIAAALEALGARRPLRAEEICRDYLLQSPTCVDHLRLLGHALSEQQRYAEAEETTRLAISLQPDFPRLHEDLGNVLSLQQRYEEAIPCFEHAIQLDPRLSLAHKKLGQALAALGRGREADEAFEQFFARDGNRGKVALALDHLRGGRRQEGLDLLRGSLREDADNVDAMRFLALELWREKERLGDAEALLRRATTLAPAYTAAWILLGLILHEQERQAEAIECYRTATELEPDNPIAWSGLGNGYAHMGDVTHSVAAFERSLALHDSPSVQLTYGHVLKTRGDLAAALKAYRAAIAAQPDFGEVYWSMANLKTFRFDDAEIVAMEAALERDRVDESADIHFRFALAKAYEDKGDYDRAWHFYQTGNERQRKRVYHDPVALELRHEQIAEVFTRELFARHAGAGFESAAPIFIVGLPRSGSTLIEQILASHSQVEGTAELPTLMRLAYSIGRYRTDRKEYPTTVPDLRARDFRAYGKQYIEESGAFRATDRPFFTDKLPNNFSHVGLIQLILPNARIINARRHPFDSCLGGYKQLFGKGQDFTYDMTDLALYYRQYHEIMQHWHDVLPGKVLDVHYEETVSDLETQVRRILEHCDLPFEQACVRFHENARAVRTASSEQVRKPIYTSAVGYWRRFEKHLGPWQDELGDIIEALPAVVRNAGL